MKPRTIKKLYEAKPTMEGAGVHLHRVFSQPEVPEFDPFLLLDDFGSDDPEDYLKGFPWHPHRGIETVTYMLSGEVEHQDSLGNKGVIKEGDVQWMTAGSGIIHQEMPQRAERALKGFQLWVNLPKKEKMTAPKYRGITKAEIPKIERKGMTVAVIAGEYEGMRGPAEDLIVDVRYLDIHLEKGNQFTYALPAHFTAFIYVYEGSASIENDEIVAERFAALTSDGDEIVIDATNTDARFIVVAGEPIKEPVAWYGPIVMNTDAELREAFIEYQEGRFIKTNPPKPSS